jgi:hypothetical protein
MQNDFNAELHARPSIYFSGPAFVEHIALLPIEEEHVRQDDSSKTVALDDNNATRTQLEFPTEFVTVTRVTPLHGEIGEWPAPSLSVREARELSGLRNARLVYQAGIVVLDGLAPDLLPYLRKFNFSDVAASTIGGWCRSRLLGLQTQQ